MTHGPRRPADAAGTGLDLILSTLFYDEPLGPAKLAGAGLVLGALVLYQLPLLLRSRKLKSPV